MRVALFRIPSREIVLASRITPPFFSAHGRSRTSFPEAARVRISQRERMALRHWRVRFLVKSAFVPGDL